MTHKKIIFISFALEDENQRGLLKGLTMDTVAEFQFVDMDDKRPHDPDWKDAVIKKVKSSDGAVILVSKNSLISEGQKWEIETILKEGKKILSLWTYTDDRTELKGLDIIPWKWDDIEDFIDRL